jgi:ubiquinone/menaquinone biosynthesis C-methylase UbiE
MQDEEYEIMFEAEKSHWWYNALHRIIDDGLLSCRLKGNLSILDVGCGTGGFISKYRGPHSIVGLDCSPIALNFCKARGLKDLTLGHVQSLPFKNESFDVVICSSVLYHQWVDDVKKALSECYRVLKKKGILLLNLPSRSCPSSEHDKRVCTSRRFSKNELTTLLINTRFSINHLTSWTTLLFPIVWLIRRFNILKSGRDFGFDQMPTNWINTILTIIMTAEIMIQKCFPLPFGVSIFCIAEKT